MSLTKAGRDRDARKLAIRYLHKLREAISQLAPVTHNGWLSDYALSFITGWVQVPMLEAWSNGPPMWTWRKLPTPQEVFALAADVAPTGLGLQPLQFSRAYEDLCKRWPEQVSPVGAPLIRGCLHGDRILRLTDFTRFEVRDDAAKEILNFVKSYERLPGRHPVLGRIFWSQSRARRYLILRTLGANVFGVTPERAGKLVFVDKG